MSKTFSYTCGRKSPPPKMRWKFFDTRSIHFRQFWATLVFVAEAPPQMREIFLTSDLSISGNFEQLWFLWQNPPNEGNFWHQIFPFQTILSNFGFCGRKAPPPHEGKFFDNRSIHLRQFRATLDFVAEKPPPRMRENFDTRSIHLRQFDQLWFLWQKSPPPEMREIFLTPDLSIWGNCEQLWILWQKSPPMRENFLTPDLFIWGNFEQIRILWQKSPPPLFSAFSSWTRLASHRSHR